MKLATTWLPAAASLVLLPAAAAQTVPAFPVTGPLHHYHLDEDTGVITPMGASSADAIVTTFSNTTTTSPAMFAPVVSGLFLVDYGVKSGNLTGDISTYQFAYASTALDVSAGGPGAKINIRLFSGTKGSCKFNPNEPGTQVLSRNFKGLPASPDGIAAIAYLMTVSVSSTSPPNLPDGPIGWGYGFGDGLTGPLLISVGVDPTGTVDKFDRYFKGGGTLNCLDSGNFATPNIASFYLELTEDDGLGPKATIRNGIGVNPVDYKPASLPALGSNYVADISTNASAGFTTAATVIAVGLGATPPPPTSIPFPFGKGELLISLSPFPILDVALGNHTLAVPANPSFNGAQLFTQGLRAEFQPGKVKVVPLNAVDLLLGP